MNATDTHTTQQIGTHLQDAIDTAYEVLFDALDGGEYMQVGRAYEADYILSQALNLVSTAGRHLADPSRPDYRYNAARAALRAAGALIGEAATWGDIAPWQEELLDEAMRTLAEAIVTPSMTERVLAVARGDSPANAVLAAETRLLWTLSVPPLRRPPSA